MFSQYFGNYLLNKGLIDSDRLREAIDLQNSTHLKLGVLAINAGYMDAAQVDEIHEKQKQVDKKFGELAVQMNYLTNIQVEELLSTQKTGSLLLGQALIDKGYMTLEQLQTALEEYKKDYSLDNKQFNALEHDDIETIIETFVKLEESPHRKIYKDYLVLFVKNIVRFLDESPMIGKCLPLEQFSPEWFVRQEIHGDINLATAISADGKTFLHIGNKYAGEQSTWVNELVRSSVAEFLNLHNGIFLVNLSDAGLDVDLKPQTVARDTPLVTGPGFAVPFHLSSGQFHLVMAGV